MKATHFILAAMVATVLTTTPSNDLWAAAPPDQFQLNDTTSAKSANEADKQPAAKPVVKVAVKDMKVNGRKATEQEKAVAKEMIRQGTRMAGKSVQAAAAALTDPSKAEQIGAELEAMGDEMERMGDSLEALAEDTTFFYEGDDAEDSIAIYKEDLDELANGLDEIGGWFEDSWLGKLLGGSIGLLAGGFGIAMVLLILFMLLLFFTAPLWIAALIFYLIGRNDRKVKRQRQERAAMTGNIAGSANAAYQANGGDGTYQSNGANASADEAALGANSAANGTTDGAANGAAPGAANSANINSASASSSHRRNYADIESPDNAMWTSGIHQCCLGVGLIIFFIAIGWTALWGIGALIACLGVAKLIIAYSAKRKTKDNYTTYDTSTYNTDSYNTGSNSTDSYDTSA